MSNTITTPKKPLGLKALLNSEVYREQFAMALPKHLPADRFVRVATTALLRTPALSDCTPESFMKCMMELSAWGIEPDGRRAHLIPFKRKFKRDDGSWGEELDCQLILDWKGLAELAQRSGQIAKLHADLICENDSFVYNLGEISEHKIDFRYPRGKPYAAYAMAVTKDGSTYVAVLTEEEIISVRNGSQGWQAFEKGIAKQSPWDPKNPTSEGEMWKKTAFRRLSKWLPLSPEFRDAVDKDDDTRFEEPRVTTGRVVAPEAIANNVTQNPFAEPQVADIPEPEPEPETVVETVAEPVASVSAVDEKDERVTLIAEIKATCHDEEITFATFGGRCKSANLVSATKTLNDVSIEVLRTIHDNRLAILKGEYTP